MFRLDTRILVLDDMSTMRRIVIRSLKEVGFVNIQEGADGNIGWDILQKSDPPIELVISDWNMPYCTGFELLKRVRLDERFKLLPFILLTAEAEAHQVKEAILAGVSEYIIKPFSTDILKAKLEQASKKVA